MSKVYPVTGLLAMLNVSSSTLYSRSLISGVYPVMDILVMLYVSQVEHAL